MATPDPEIVRFIRDDLGCSCPDDVLKEIRIERPWRTLDAGGGSVRIDVGGRLLVLVLAVGSTPSGLAELVVSAAEGGLAERDRLSFNRLRVVVASPSPSAVDPSARDAFEAWQRPDDRIHLHVVATRSLPASIRPPG